MADEAIKLLQGVIAKNHVFHKAHGALADLLLKQNRAREAIEAMRTELEINSKQPDRQVQPGKLLLKEGDALGAVEHYRVALQADPKRLGALMGMGHAYAMADNLDKALYYFKRVRRYHPTQTKALEAAVRCALQANETKKAEMFLRDEKSAHPDRTDVYVVLTMLYVRQERDDDALALVAELLERDPENAQGLRLRGMLYLRKKDFNNAVLALQGAARVAPSGDVFSALGEAYLGLNKVPEAMAALHKALSMNPESPATVLTLAEAHRASKQWIKAALLYRRAAMLGAPKERCQEELRGCMRQVQARRRPRVAS
jgi:tetratricopeptide (TPR) repeat protein